MRSFTPRPVVTLLGLLFSISAWSAEPLREWSFLIFLNGHNNLDSYGEMNINQMEKIGSSDQLNVLVQWASMNKPTTQRLWIQKDDDFAKVTSPVVQDLGKPADMGDPQSLEDFITWGAENFPAKHYFVVVWDHGSGWHLNSLNKPRPRGGIYPQDISWDDRSGNYMTTEQLGQVIDRSAQRIGHKIDIVGTDACLMAMTEVAGELASNTSVFVGSEEVEPGAGWPYDTFLQRWMAKPNASAADVGRFLVEEYTASYSGGSNGKQEVTLSAIALDQLGGLAQEMKVLGQKLARVTSAEAAKVLVALKASQTFTYSDYVDLAHFGRLLEAQKIDGLSSLIKRVQKAQARLVIANGTTDAYREAGGVAFWMPRSSYTYDQYIRRYSALHWNQSTQWDQALAHLLPYWRESSDGNDTGVPATE